MPVDRRIVIAVESIRQLLVDTEAVVLHRGELTDIWRKADMTCVWGAWNENRSVAADSTLMPGAMKAVRTRLSRGQALVLQLALEEVGIHCEPRLGRLSSMNDTVRLYRKWRNPSIA